MSLAIDQDIAVRVAPGKDPHQMVTREGAQLWAVDEAVNVFLSAQQYPTDVAEREAIIDDLRGGRTITVRVIDESLAESGLWLVSCRHVLQGNPWQDVVPGWEPGVTSQRMRVTSIHADQAYGEIMPGVVGRISLHEMPDYVNGRDETYTPVLVGDYLMGYVETPDEENRLVPLDVVAYLLDLDAQSVPSSASESLSLPSTSERDDPSKSFGQLPFHIHRVLVVEDEPRSLQAIKRCLDAYNLQVEIAQDERVALEIVKESLYYDDSASGTDTVPHGLDVAIVDVKLQDDDPISGLRLAKQLREIGGEIKILLMSGNADISTKLIQGDAIGLEVHGFLAKPFGAFQLRAELAQVAQATAAPPTSFFSVAPGSSVDIAPPRPLSAAKQTPQRYLDALRREIGAEQVALFSIHPFSLLTTCVAGDHPKPNREGRGWGFWRQKLRYSPVRDVAIDGDTVLEADASDDQRFPRHRWLQRAYGYRSCIGVPVRIVDEEAYSVFAFHASRNVFTREHRAIARAYAAELAALLEKERLLRVLEEAMHHVASGLTLHVLGHELRTLLSAAVLDADYVAARVLHVADTPMSALRDPVVGLQEAVHHAAAIAEIFMDAARKEERPVCVLQCVEDAMRLARQRVQELGAQLILGVIPDSLRVQAERVALEQVLFNLFVNAAEQGHHLQDRRRWVTVSAQPAPENPQLLQILVQDNGPGIHYCWWESIFAPGFTTKTGGSGLGLHICRRTLEKLQGTIKVHTSTLWVGTTFVLTIPLCAPPQESSHGSEKGHRTDHRR